MILKIDIDRTRNKVTIEERSDHSYRSRGGGTLKWKVAEGQGHAGWRVRFHDGRSPFEDGTVEFGTAHGADGGRLRKNRGSTAEHYPYDAWCTDSTDTTYDTDPEVVLEPE